MSSAGFQTGAIERRRCPLSNPNGGVPRGFRPGAPDRGRGVGRLQTGSHEVFLYFLLWSWQCVARRMWRLKCTTRLVRSISQARTYYKACDYRLEGQSISATPDGFKAGLKAGGLLKDRAVLRRLIMRIAAPELLKQKLKLN